MYRVGMCTDSVDPAGVYLPIDTGDLYASNDEGDTWNCVTTLLPPALSVNASYFD